MRQRSRISGSQIISFTRPRCGLYIFNFGFAMHLPLSNPVKSASTFPEGGPCLVENKSLTSFKGEGVGLLDPVSCNFVTSSLSVSQPGLLRPYSLDRCRNDQGHRLSSTSNSMGLTFHGRIEETDQ